jgi:hypothetical protein
VNLAAHGAAARSVSVLAFQRVTNSASESGMGGLTFG